MSGRRWTLVLAALVVFPLLTVAAQRRFRASPGENPNPNVAYDGRFTFLRVRFEPLGGSRDLKWDHDYPRSENHFMKIMDELTTVHPRLDGSNILAFGDPEIFKYPFAYVSEPGFWTMSPQELQGVRPLGRVGEVAERQGLAQLLGGEEAGGGLLRSGRAGHGCLGSWGWARPALRAHAVRRDPRFPAGRAATWQLREETRARRARPPGTHAGPGGS